MNFSIIDHDTLFAIAKIVDNEYIGKEKTFSAEVKGLYYHLSTNARDSASFIRVYRSETNRIEKITRLGEGTEGWEDVQPATLQRVNEYLSKNTEE